MRPKSTSGERLFNWLLVRYKGARTESSWVELIAKDFMMPAIGDYLFRSTCLMVMRRLIWNGHWYLDKYGSSSKDDRINAEKYYEREYLRSYIGLHKGIASELRVLVYDAINASNKNIPASLKKRIFERARGANQRCKLCGDQIDYLAKMGTEKRSFSLDHIWPQSLGGESEEWNLQEAHQFCNNERKNLAEASDIHYEHFHVKSEYDPKDTAPSFWKELDWGNKLAALFISEFKCAECNDDVTVDNFEGNVIYSVIDRSENYNIFNIRVTCERHQKLLKEFEQ